MPAAIDLDAAFAAVRAPWTPVIAADVNDHQVKLATFLGEFAWHRHDGEDELFLVLRGRIRVDFRDGSVDVGEGQMLRVPRGVEHRPVAEKEARVLLFEPASTLNTGNVREGRTVERPARI